MLAADQFVVTPAGRLPDTTRAYASGDEMRTVIAGYHWFTDWGRDTMISLEGLTLTTNRFLEAGWILRNFANAIRQGLIPNLFPEGSREGLYHTADATLWFFHAIDRYLQATGDRWTLRLLLPKLIDIIDCHIKGTLFGIGVDSKDGLLSQGQENYQLTWMDAKVDDWVVTPRRGKAVEINGLWYNALRLLQQWLSEEEQPDKALELKAHADRARTSFNERFWYNDEGYLFDVIDGEGGNDAACRPNQLLAISLRHPVLDSCQMGTGVGNRSPAAFNSGGTTLSGSGPSELQSEILWRFALPGCGLPSRNRLGLVDRTFHRRLVKGPSRGRRRSARAAGRIRAPSGGSWCWIHQ